jgi:hypothetical protein
MHGPTRPETQRVDFEHGEAGWEILVRFEDESVDGPGWDWQPEVLAALKTVSGQREPVRLRDVPDAVRERALELALESAYW